MRAARFDRFGSPDVLRIVDLPDPHPGAGEVRIRVAAAGVNASDWRKRRGEMDQELPQTLGYEAAGIVDEVGSDVPGTSIGDRVFGFCGSGAAQAELAVLTGWARIPEGLDAVHAAALPSTVETAARALDRLGVTDGGAHGLTVLISGASGSIGTAAVQIALDRGARVIGTGSPATFDHLREIGAEPVPYGTGLSERVRALAPDGVDRALDVAGSGILPELVALAGGADHVVTVADFPGAREHGVHFSRGDDGRADYALDLARRLVAAGRFVLPVGRTFPLADVAEAHRVGEAGSVRGKLVLTIG